MPETVAELAALHDELTKQLEGVDAIKARLVKVDKKIAKKLDLEAAPADKTEKTAKRGKTSLKSKIYVKAGKNGMTVQELAKELGEEEVAIEKAIKTPPP